MSSPTFQRAQSVDGIKALADRLFQGHSDAFVFKLASHHDTWSRWNTPSNDNYSVEACSDNHGKICISGTNVSALARGLRHYSTDVLHLDTFWFVESSAVVPKPLPLPSTTLTGQSTVPWRYNFNTGTPPTPLLHLIAESQLTLVY